MKCFQKYQPIGMLLVSATLAANCGAPTGADTENPPLNLVKKAEFTLEDPEARFQYLEQLTLLPDGGFVASDIVARKVRRFDSDGRLLGQIGPPPLDRSDEWSPMSSGLGSDGVSLWVNDRRGRMWKFNLEDGSALLDSSNRQLILFAVSPRDVFVARRPLGNGELHLYEDGAFVKHFLQSDQHNLAIGGRASPALTFDREGDIYAIRHLEGTVFAFTSRGEPIRSWPIVRDRNFREVPRGVNPLKTTRDRNVLMAWHRTFTTFPRIEYLAGDRLAVLLANDPPERPNTLAVYSLRGDFLGSAEVDEYLVGASGNDLFFSDKHLFFDGVCRIARYQLTE